MAERAHEVPENEFVRTSVSRLLAHESRFGADHVADAAVRAWRTAQARLDGRADRERLSVVAELAEIAGWMLFDAGRHGPARRALLASRRLCRLAGDRRLEWFTLDLLAMHGVEAGQAAEALRLAEALVDVGRLPPRVVLLSQLRTARALALTGERARAVAALARARGGLEDSPHPRDPAWAWWVDALQVSGHAGEVFLALGEHERAIHHLEHTNALVAQSGSPARNALYYAVATLTAYAHAGAWTDCERVLGTIGELIGRDRVTSARSRARLRRTLRVIDRDAPRRLLGTALETGVSRAERRGADHP